jgi:hypothetical protein
MRDKAADAVHLDTVCLRFIRNRMRSGVHAGWCCGSGMMGVGASGLKGKWERQQPWHLQHKRGNTKVVCVS